jgi:hypothetical protein
MSFLIEKKWFTRESVEKLVDFLLENGWNAYPTKLKGAFIYKNIDNDGYEASFSFPIMDRVNWESPSLMAKFSDIISAVADFYNQTPEDFFNRLVQVKDSADTLLIKFHEGETVDSVSYSTFLPLLQEVGDAIAQTFHCDKDKKSASQPLLERCRIGQTFAGSYGITLKVPFHIQYPLPFSREAVGEEIAIPPERRAVEKFFSILGIVSLHNAKEAKDLLIESCKESPVLCLHLRKIVGKTDDAGVVFELVPAKELPLREGVPKGALHVKRSMLEPVNQALDVLSQEKDASGIKTRTVKGMVTDLSKGTKKTIIEDEKLNVRIFSEELKRKIMVSNVALEDYFKAMDAQRQDRPVSINGVLTENPRLCHMKDFIFLWD